LTRRNERQQHSEYPAEGGRFSQHAVTLTAHLGGGGAVINIDRQEGVTDTVESPDIRCSAAGEREGTRPARAYRPRSLSYSVLVPRGGVKMRLW